MSMPNLSSPDFGLSQAHLVAPVEVLHYDRGMTSEKLGQLRQVIVRANPEIEFRIFAATAKSTAKTARDWQPDQTVIVNGFHQIHLADVLLAVQKLICSSCNGAGSRLGQNLGVAECSECGGEGYLMPQDLIGSDFSLLHVVNSWNLRKDSLDDQEPATIVFLHSLLCNP